ncbi:MAG: ferrochelatase [Alphaproteobacteria bacterium]|nr:ferrochelatase [Alphaproteobacteria bacterium]
MTLPSNHLPVVRPKIGVLLVNLGTPDAPTPAAVRRYLGEFLSDRRVVEIAPLLWQPILRGIILQTRPRKSAHAYTQIWCEEGSPLAVITGEQAAALSNVMNEKIIIKWSMRYGNPSICEKLKLLHEMGCTRILVAPLYPHYCAATTASVMDAVSVALGAMRWQPAIRILPPYYDDQTYIAALAESVRAHFRALDFPPDLILASFHGMPARTLAAGDPYHCHCLKTARLLSEALNREVRVSFQSRFGRDRWLEPATDATLSALPDQGIKKIAVITPGFAADCLETLEEIGMRGRATFMAHGGTHFSLIPCLNASPPGMVMLQKLMTRELAGWLPTA